MRTIAGFDGIGALKVLHTLTQAVVRPPRIIPPVAFPPVCGPPNSLPLGIWVILSVPAVGGAGAFFLVIALLSCGGMGSGDVKLADDNGSLPKLAAIAVA